jgi:hypothetical protein
MDTLEYRVIIEQVLTEYAKYPCAAAGLETRLLFDRERDQYALMVMDWQDIHRTHSCVAHLEVVNGKIWIQEDNTEEGIATDLEAAGVPKGHIVLGFRHPDIRKYTDYAVA